MKQPIQTRLVRIIVDPSILSGEFHIGGVRVVKIDSDEVLGRELRTTEVRVHDDIDAKRVRTIIRNNIMLEET